MEPQRNSRLGASTKELSRGLGAGRFAPTPSGALHLGSARTALAAWGVARWRGARFVLRVEDLDVQRTKEGATERMLEELRWLGLPWDEGPDLGGPAGPYAQSQRGALYASVLAWLRERGLVYPCRCSRREVEQASVAPHGAEPVYPGTCRGRAAEDVLREAEAAGRAVCWRFAVEAGTQRTVHDAVAGDFTQDVAREVGDFVVFRADGVAAYQLAVVVDDVAMGVDHVVRGADLLSSAPRQALLAESLGAAPPAWVHVPLVVGPGGERLAKRHGSVSLSELRARGLEPDRLRAVLLASLGGATEHGALDPSCIPAQPSPLAELERALGFPLGATE